MADQGQLKRLRRSVENWNEWRRQHPEIHPNLVGANLSGADLNGAILDSANLNGANLSGAILNRASLDGANLSGAILNRASLDGTNLNGAILNRASLGGANLNGARLIDAILDNANLASVRFGYTTFAWVDLSNVRGLETATHSGPSTVNISSVKLPVDESTRKRFLRGVGFTETLIEYLPSLLTPRPLQYASLFLSYAHQDEALARRLDSDLRHNDVPCWFAPHDLTPGDFFREKIDQAIHAHEKLLLLLSRHSVESPWVKYEVNRALHREIGQDRQILYPIRLDDAVFTCSTEWAADLRTHRHIGDFTGWQDHAVYQQTFSRLLQDLKVDKLPPS